MESICNAVKTGILPRNAFDNVIPAGTAIQNARQKLGDVFCADNYHLNDFGAYICGLSWVCFKQPNWYKIKKETGLNGFLFFSA